MASVLTPQEERLQLQYAASMYRPNCRIDGFISCWISTLTKKLGTRQLQGPFDSEVFKMLKAVHVLACTHGESTDNMAVALSEQGFRGVREVVNKLTRVALCLWAVVCSVCSHVHPTLLTYKYHLLIQYCKNKHSVMSQKIR